MVRSAWNQNAGQLTEALASAYLKEHDHSGLSAWTASRDMAAINKVLGFDLSKKELGLRQRNNTEITRSRMPTTSFPNMLTRLRLPRLPESMVHP